MFLEDYTADDFNNPHDMLIYLDAMSEILAKFIERAIDLKDRVENLGCFITDAIDPLTEEEIAKHRDKLRTIRDRYCDLF